MGICAGCGEELVRRHQKKFCSNRCQRALERREHTRRWLETGEATMSGSRGHFVKHYLIESQQHVCDICGSPDHWMG